VWYGRKRVKVDGISWALDRTFVHSVVFTEAIFVYNISTIYEYHLFPQQPNFSPRPHCQKCTRSPLRLFRPSLLDAITR
jgi:hypothetical protein